MVKAKLEHKPIIMALAFACRVGADLQLMQVSARGPVNDDSALQMRTDCHTSVVGDQCYEEVLWAMQTGIFEHREWYPSLSEVSSFEDFQRHLHGVARLSEVCAEPCAAQAQEVPVPAVLRLPAPEDCRTPVEGDDCYQEVLYAMQTGVVAHPDAYGNLTRNSSFEDFQQRLHKVDAQVCPEPCAAQARSTAHAQYFTQHLEVAWPCATGRFGSSWFTLQQVSVTGEPIYSNSDGTYLYWDPSCDGYEREEFDRSPRWIIDRDEPNASLAMDLDSDGTCSYLGHYSQYEPFGSNMWTVWCEGALKDMMVTISRMR